MEQNQYVMLISGRNGQKETEKGFQKKVLLKKAGLKTEKKSWNKEKKREVQEME